MSDYIASLDDLAPVCDEVSVRGKLLRIDPLSLAQIGGLMHRHKSLRDMFNGESVNFYDAIMEAGDQVVRDVVDCATGLVGIGERLTGVEQGNVVLSCLDMTIPEDSREVRDFLAQLTALARRATPLAEAVRVSTPGSASDAPSKDPESPAPSA